VRAGCDGIAGLEGGPFLTPLMEMVVVRISSEMSVTEAVGGNGPRSWIGGTSQATGMNTAENRDLEGYGTRPG
jgi:hypothetical protein